MSDKTITVTIPERTAELLKQFVHTDNRGKYKPIYLVQSLVTDCYGERRYETEAYFFSEEEAERYIEYQNHNLISPRSYAAAPGYANEGDWEPFYDLLTSIGQKIDAGDAK